MATTRQVRAAKRNVGKAREAARRSRSIAHLRPEVRSDLGRQGAKARARGGSEGHSLEDRSRAEIYEVAKREKIRGRSKMGKWELIEAIRGGR
jgi:hypothetical protein